MAFLFGGGDYGDPQAAKETLEELVKERENLQVEAKELEQEIAEQQRILEEKKAKAEAAQRKAAQFTESANVMVEKAKSKDMDLKLANQRLQSVLSLLSLEGEFHKVGEGLARVREGLFPSPLVISGPPSVGKATLISMILREFESEFSVPIAHTSRTPTEDECDGEDYIFMSREEMQEGIKKGMFLEVAEIDGDLYGTAMQIVKNQINAGKICILHIDLAGVEQIRKTKLEPIFVWISPPSLEALRERMIARGITDEEEIEDRLSQAENDMKAVEDDQDLFDYHITNDNLQEAYKQLKLVLTNYPHLEDAIRKSLLA